MKQDGAQLVLHTLSTETRQLSMTSTSISCRTTTQIWRDHVCLMYSTCRDRGCTLPKMNGRHATYEHKCKSKWQQNLDLPIEVTMAKALLHTKQCMMCTGLFYRRIGCRQLHCPCHKRSRCLCPGESCSLTSCHLLHKARAQQAYSPTAACRRSLHANTHDGIGLLVTRGVLDDLGRPYLSSGCLQLTGQGLGSGCCPGQRTVPELVCSSFASGPGYLHRQRRLCSARALLCTGWHDSLLM